MSLAAGCWLALAVGVPIPVSTALGQCPDGTPPPCTRAPDPRRAAFPPLNDRAWIVLPFENIARAPDIEWLRDGSVSLLYADLSRWRDVLVVDDDRVADLLRTLPPESRERLGLEGALQLARRAGAGRLVTGDLLKIGQRIQVVAKVYEVRTGRRTRLVREDAAGLDSVIPAFGRLARAILELPSPAGGADLVGTASVEAYREYMAGVRAMNAWRLDSASYHLERAVSIDSTFALAHYRLTTTHWWGLDNERTRRHAEAATRFGASLPPRERLLIETVLALVSERWGRACELSARLLARDSADAEAWYNQGECSYHDPVVIPYRGDTSRSVFRSSWNTALRAFRRVLDLDPSYHLAYYHILDILRSDNRNGCRQEPEDDCAYRALLLRDADTLVESPIETERWAEHAAANRVAWARARQSNLVDAREVAARWVAAGPDEVRARTRYAELLNLTGNLDAAEREIGAAARLSPDGSSPQLVAWRVEVLVKLGRMEEAARLADSLAAVGDTTEEPEHLNALLGAVFGRFRRVTAHWPDSIPLGPYLRAVALLGAGVVPHDLERVEQAWDSAAADRGPGARTPAARASRLRPTSVLAFRWRGRGPVHDPAADDPLLRAQALMSTGDRAAARGAIVEFDGLLRNLPEEEPERIALLPFVAEAFLELGDTAAAFSRLEDFHRHMNHLPMRYALGQATFIAGAMWGRAWLLLGDLATATGRASLAADAYRRVVGMWNGGDNEVQPMVSRARAALAAMR
jgi:tetratricopeptide (TPR) repeat protein/TolB-like protein